MAQKIVYTNNDGSVAIITPADEALTIMTIEQIAVKDVPDDLSYRITGAENIPSDRVFRDAWTDANPGDAVDIDMAKAKSIQMDRVRAARDVKWPDFDARYMAAQRDSMDLTALDAGRQTLKDIPNNAQIDVDAAADVTALKAAWPFELT